MLVTPRSKHSSIARAAARGTPLPLRLARTLLSADLMRIFEEHKNEGYGNELAELLLSAPMASSALVEKAVQHFPSSLGVLNAAALCSGTSPAQLAKLARSQHRSVRLHAKLSLLSDSLNRAPQRDFVKAVARAKRASDCTEQLYIVVTHRDTPRAVLLTLAASAPDLIRMEAKRRLRRKRRSARKRSASLDT